MVGSCVLLAAGFCAYFINFILFSSFAFNFAIQISESFPWVWNGFSVFFLLLVVGELNQIKLNNKKELNLDWLLVLSWRENWSVRGEGKEGTGTGLECVYLAECCDLVGFRSIRSDVAEFVVFSA